MNQYARFWRSCIILTAIYTWPCVDRLHAEPSSNMPLSEAMRFHLDSSPRLGSDDAPVTLVDFSDYTCAFCSSHALQEQPLLIEQHVASGTLRYVALELPSKNPESPSHRAAQAALCASDQDKYWDMRRRLFENIGQFESEQLTQHAEELALDVGAFKECLDSHKHTAKILANIRDADEADIRTVPTFFLGLTDPQHPDIIHADIKIGGVKPDNVFTWAIEELLDRSRAKQVLTSEDGATLTINDQTNEEVVVK